MDLKDSHEFDKVPSHMLIEATGDSEDDSNDSTIDEFGYDDDDDDAESCCHDNAAEFKVCKSEDEEVKKSDVYGSSYIEDDDIQEQKNYKSYVSDDSSDQKFLDEMEKNRLFWEACLAS
ncbi:nonsense-mediated mRNA decay protein 2 [Vicia villosa]|uniref:nonsense-mediated mRNA decay protein 2 n=1 Tax=Vicia villosa TaxID=3911 RepID=UPI00273CD3E8|nr:nonsense-mediated mRNA decay protein 2 [Vicia villosa]